MTYTDVVNNGWILAKKAKYTMGDVNNLIVDSLFSKPAFTFSVPESKFIIRCSAIYHDTDYSKACKTVGITNII